MRPGYVTHCPICFERIETVDTYEGSRREPKKPNVWITRWFDPDWVIHNHIITTHKS